MGTSREESVIVEISRRFGDFRNADMPGALESACRMELNFRLNQEGDVSAEIRTLTLRKWGKK